MGCRPSKQATSKVRAAEDESLDPRCLGSPCHKHRSHGVTRSEGQRVQHSYSEGCHKARAPPNTDADFPAFSTTSAVYRYSASRTSKITLRLSCDGSTLEIEHCDYDLERSRKEREADDAKPRLWGSAPDLGKHGQWPGHQGALCSPPGLMVRGEAPVWPLRPQTPSPANGDKPEEVKGRGRCCQQTVCAVVYDSKGRPVTTSVHQLGDDTKRARPISMPVQSDSGIYSNDKQPRCEIAQQNFTRTFENTHGSKNDIKQMDCQASKRNISSNHVKNKDVAKIGKAEPGNQETNETRVVGASSESTYQRSRNSVRHSQVNTAFNDVSPASQSSVHENDLRPSHVTSKTDKEKDDKSRKSHHNVVSKSTSKQPRENVNTLSNHESNARLDSQLNTRSLNRTGDSCQDMIPRLDQDKFVLPLRIPDRGFSRKYWCPGVQQDPDGPSSIYGDHTDPSWSHSTIAGTCSCFTSDFESAEDADTILALVALGCPLSSEKGSVCMRRTCVTNTAPITSTTRAENVCAAGTPSSDSDDFYTPLQEFAPGQVNGVPYSVVPDVHDPLSPASFQSATEDQNIQETIGEDHMQTMGDGVTEPGTEKEDVSKSEELRTMEILDALASNRNGAGFASEKCQLHNMSIVDGRVAKHSSSESTDHAASRENTVHGNRQKSTGEARTTEGKLDKHILEMINQMENKIIERLKDLGENIDCDRERTADCDQGMNDDEKRVKVDGDSVHRSEVDNLVDEEEDGVVRKAPSGQPPSGVEQWRRDISDAFCSICGGLKTLRPDAIYQTDMLTACAHISHAERRQDGKHFNDLATSRDFCGLYGVGPNTNTSQRDSSEEKEMIKRGSGVEKCVNANISNLGSKDTKNGNFGVNAGENGEPFNVAGRELTIHEVNALPTQRFYSPDNDNHEHGDTNRARIAARKVSTENNNACLSFYEGINQVQVPHSSKAISVRPKSVPVVNAATTGSTSSFSPAGCDVSGHVTLPHPGVQELAPDTITATTTFAPSCKEIKDINLSSLQKIDEDEAPSRQTSQEENVDCSPSPELLHKEEGAHAARVARDVAPVLPRENVISQSSTGNDAQAAKSLPLLGSCFIQEEIPEDIADSDESGMKSQLMSLRDGILLKNIQSTARQNEMKEKDGMMSEERPSGDDQCGNVAQGDERKKRLDTLATSLRQGRGQVCDGSNYSPGLSLSSCLPGPLGQQCLSQPSIYACVVGSRRSIQGSFTSGRGSLGERPKSDESGRESVRFASEEPERDRLNWTSPRCGLFGVSRPVGAEESKTNLSASIVFSGLEDVKSTKTDTACFAGNAGRNGKWKYVYSETALLDPDAVEFKTTSDCDSSSILLALSEIVNGSPTRNATSTRRSWKHGGSLGENDGANEVRRNTAGEEKSGMIEVGVRETGMARSREESGGTRKSVPIVEEKGKAKVVKETEEQNGRGRGKYDKAMRLCHEENVGSGKTHVGLCTCSGSNNAANVKDLMRNQGRDILLCEADGHVHLRGGICEPAKWNGEAVGMCGRDEKNTSQALTCLKDERREIKMFVEDVNSKVTHLSSSNDGGLQKYSKQSLQSSVTGETDWGDTRRMRGDRFFNEPMIGKSQTFRESKTSLDEGTVCTFAASRKGGSEGKQEIKSEFDGSREEEEGMNSFHPHTRQSHQWNQGQGLGGGGLRSEGSNIADKNCGPWFNTTPKLNKSGPTTNQHVMRVQVNEDRARHPSLTEQSHSQSMFTHQTNIVPNKHCPTNDWSLNETIRQKTSPTCLDKKQEWRTDHCPPSLPATKKKSFNGDAASSESNSFVSESNTNQLGLIPDATEPDQRTYSLGMCSDSAQGQGADLGCSLVPRRPEETQNVLDKELFDQAVAQDMKRLLGEEEAENGQEKESCRLENTTEGAGNLPQPSVQLLVKYFETFPVGTCELKQ